MSVPRFKRKPSGLDYIENAYDLQQELMNLASKLSARWARIYQQPIDRLAFLQADFVNMAYNITPTKKEDAILRRVMFMLSKACLNALEVRVTAMCRVLYNNPSKCFNRKNGKNYSYQEATEMLDKKLEQLGVKYARQYDLLKGIIASDKKKYDKIFSESITDEDIIKIMVSKLFSLYVE